MNVAVMRRALIERETLLATLKRVLAALDHMARVTDRRTSDIGDMILDAERVVAEVEVEP